MKKIFTLVCFALATISANAQYNLFDAADCDAAGWLWFDTEAKIAKYVGNATDKQDPNGFDWENYTVNPNGKYIQLAFADITPDYPASFANEAIEGTDAAGYMAGQEQYVEGQAKTGCIYLEKSSASTSILGTTNGGCLILNLPSCSSIALFMSSESTYLGRTLMVTPGFPMREDDKTGDEIWTGKTKCIYSRASRFAALHDAGQWKWETAATDHGNTNGDLTFVSNNPVYFVFQNCNNNPVYIHGIKVTTPTPASIQQISTEANGTAQVYSLDGRKLQGTVRGLNIIRQNGVTRKVIK